MRNYTAIIERCARTGLLVAHVPEFTGAHTQGTSMEELRTNLEEVIAMLLEDGDPVLESEFVGTRVIRVG
jgi:predicted RNase H-like HicB family nuclease